MKIELKNRFNGDVIFSHECDNNSIKITLKKAVFLKINLSNANLSNADLSRADLSNANLSNADLSNADLSNANLSGAYLSNANLSGAYLSNANLSNANLSNANLSNANLSNADLSNADLSRANLSNANLSNADLSGVDMRRSVGNMKEIKNIMLDKWQVVFTKNIMAIGCQQHTIDEWKNFDEDEIHRMNRYSLQWWKKWKDFIFMAIELSPGE